MGQIHPVSSVALVVAFWQILIFLPGMAKEPEGRGGLSSEARETIHTLFEKRDRIRREVKETKDGYEALTESDDPSVASALKLHVRQMEKRLKSGLSVRRWDPAFAQYCDHYAEMKHRFEATEHGVRMIVTATDPLVVRIARNHAGVVSKFVSEGWAEHDREHPGVRP